MVKKKKKCDNGVEQITKPPCPSSSSSSPWYDKDTAFFISMSQELKELGNQCFQIRDYEGAMLKYDKAIKLLPGNHIDVSYLRSNMAACHMQMGISEYPSAIHQCNLALEVTPKYTKALLKRARCYEALNRFDLALRDVNSVSSIEPNNLMALEIADSVKKKIGSHENKDLEKSIHVAPESIKTKVKARRKRSNTNTNKLEDNDKARDKVVVEEQIVAFTQEEPKKTVKLVCGEDIRWAQLPQTCSLLHLREVISDRFPRSKAVLIKYRDPEGDLVTITTDDEIILAETSSGDSQGSLRLYVIDVPPEQDPFFDKIRTYQFNKITAESENGSVGKCTTEKGSPYLDDWIIQFAQLFKNHVGFESDTYKDLHKLGMKLYSEAMEETVTSKEAQDLFDTAADKFEEMAALALFNCANVHMSKARKKVYFTEEDDVSKESQFLQIKTTYDWAQIEYSKAGNLYEESLKIKPDFHEAVLALGQQQFEQAKLSWYYAIGSKVDLETWPSTEVLQLYNSAEDNMEKGMKMWEESEERRINDTSKPRQIRTQLSKRGFEGSFKDIAVDEALEQASNMRSQINLLWGTILYERSIMEFKLELPVWQECLEVSVEKFELAGASATDIGVMIKNHCSNNNALEGMGFNIDEIIQAWNDMYEAKQWQSGVPSFRLEPLFRRRVPPIYHAWEHGRYAFQ